MIGGTFYNIVGTGIHFNLGFRVKPLDVFGSRIVFRGALSTTVCEESSSRIVFRGALSRIVF